MCEFCNAKIFVQVERFAKPVLAPLTPVEALHQEIVDLTGIDYIQIKAKWCPMCRKEIRRLI